MVYYEKPPAENKGEKRGSKKEKREFMKHYNYESLPYPKRGQNESE